MLSIVIPAFNEEKRIGYTLESISSWVSPAEILVIFDGNDRTPEVARKFPVKLYVSKKRLGKGGALKKGIENSSYQKVLLIDADLPIKEEDLDKIIGTKGDLVITRRKIIGMPLKRRFLHKSFIILTKMFFPSLVGFSDFQAGVKLLDKDKTMKLMDELIVNDLLFDVNLIYAFKRRKYNIREVEISYIHDETDSKISRKLFKVIVLMFLSLIKLRIYYSPFKAILKSKTFMRVQNFIIDKLR